MDIIVALSDGEQRPIYYCHYDAHRGRAVFGEKKAAVRMSPDIAQSVRKQLQTLSYDVTVMDDGVRFNKKHWGIDRKNCG